MKHAILVIAALLCLSGTAPAQGVVSFGFFYSSLDPYGEWIPLEGGIYGWRPVHAVVDWRPYTVGRWAWTPYGWYWVSEEPWGWATYHYGRWYYDDFYGWIWIPGYDWAPAWVEWRFGGDYIGWAPLGPYAVWGFHVGITYRRHWATPDHWWAFAHCRHITSHGIHRHLYRTRDNSRYIGRTRSAGNVRYRDGRIVAQGPGREAVEQRGRLRLETTEVVDISERGERLGRDGGRERIEVYRPRVEDRRLDVVERPGKVIASDRRVRLEPERMDVRVRSLERATGREAGREIQREARPPKSDVRSMERPRDAERARPAPREERREAPERKRPESLGRPEKIERSAPAAPEVKERREPERMERARPKREEVRSSPPERTVRRPAESRPAPEKKREREKR